LRPDSSAVEAVTRQRLVPERRRPAAAVGCWPLLPGCCRLLLLPAVHEYGLYMYMSVLLYF
jgi:hypothetical protein